MQTDREREKKYNLAETKAGKSRERILSGFAKQHSPVLPIHILRSKNLALVIFICISEGCVRLHASWRVRLDFLRPCMVHSKSLPFLPPLSGSG